mgnify:CR=1 FL=1
MAFESLTEKAAECIQKPEKQRPSDRGRCKGSIKRS